MKQRKLLSQRHPILYFLAVWTRRFKRYIDWYFDNKKYAVKRTAEKLPFRLKKHQSTLLRKLGESNEILQLNKVTNLKIAVKEIDGIIIKSGETFSFCKLVGLPTKRKGYLLGMELSFGEAIPGFGGGICQISNMIHWLVMHSVGSPEIRPFEIRILQAYRRGRQSKRITNFKTENYEENKIYRSTNRKGAQTA